MNKILFEVALKYVEKGYDFEDLRYGDDLYKASPEEIEECLEYYSNIKEEGTKWAYKQLNDE